MVRFDADIDSRVGELICRILRRWPERVSRASHGTWYDGFSMEVLVPDARDATNDVPNLVRAAAGHAAADIHSLLQDSHRAFAMVG